ncbi:MAG: hypothetical protein CMA72_09460 [Euryarchaeota archaeon]|nr:hypothetical protein [Euryarchaeota archaeon]|tara:strand:+ start:3950 stop:4789 length:840 start_codon:yes stop_codon:yes gene_type:complete
MAGILNQNSRILDFILTTAGRRRLAEDGNLDISFASFSDKGAYYTKLSKTGSVADDGSRRLYVEANSPTSDNLYFVSGSESAAARVEISADQMSSHFFTNFTNLSVLTTKPVDAIQDFKFDSTGFNIEFVPEQLDVESGVTLDVSNMSAVFQDKRFQHFDNYKFLPPINGDDGSPLADYQKLNSEEIVTPQALEDELAGKKKFVINFEGDATPRNIRFRILENQVSATGNACEPLQIIDYGSYTLRDGLKKKVFFVGRVYETTEAIPVFANMFTLVFND